MRSNGFAVLFNWNYSATSSDNPIFNVYQNNGPFIDLAVQRNGQVTANISDPSNSSMVFLSGTYEAQS